MRLSKLILGLLLLAGWQGSAKAADLTKIPRTLVREPVYQTKEPRYCLLVFGPEAKTRGWLVLDGNALYVDRNGNGDLTEPGKRVTGTDLYEIGDVTETDGKTKHTQLLVKRKPMGFLVSVLLEGKHKQQAGGNEEILEFADRRQDAPIIHFAGPLTLRLAEEEQKWVPGKSANILIRIGTNGLGSGTFADYLHSNLPKDTFPVADIEFSAKNPDGKLIQAHISLNRP